MSIIRHREENGDRFSIAEPTHDDPVLVVCPRCSAKAIVTPLGEGEVRVICASCGYTKQKPNTECGFDWNGETATDGYFGLDLWLRTDCNGHSLWAFNLRHLAFLESFVSARLRERKKDDQRKWSNSSLESRLPGWIKASKNRDALIKAIHELKAKA